MIEPTIDFTSPMGPPSNYQDPYKKANTRNPLLDLVETEQKYVEDLKCLLIKVTANWSSDDLPPTELDIMFRHIESIYRQNKKFYLKLSKVESNQADLNDILTIWINDMSDSYTKYIENFTSGFDSRPEIEENLSLQQTLNDISAEKNQPISLEYFFDMPIKRIHYYKKLYMRLFKNAESFDDNLLLAANERIDRLLEMEKEIKNSNKIKEAVATSPVIEKVAIFPPVVAEDVYSVIVPPAIEIYQVDEDHVDHDGCNNYDEQDNFATKSPPIDIQITSSADHPVYPGITISTDEDKKSWNLEELESQLDTSKTKDLFTKLPKVVKVSLLSSDLPFKREIVLHDDFTIGTTKFMNSIEIHNMDVHAFLLTDLLLICQQITQEEKQESFSDKNLRLIFPPFNADFLAINDVNDDRGDILELTILQKEMLILYPENKEVKDNWLREITKAITNANKSNAGLRILRKAESNPRLSTASSLSISANELKRSPSVGNLIKREINSLRPTSSISQMSSISRNSSLFSGFSSADLPVRSLTPGPPQNAGGEYPGDYLPSGQGIGLERHSDPISSQSVRNKLNVGLQLERERSNSITSLSSVMSIANFKETVFSSSACKVFIWNTGEWKPLTKKDNCIVEVRLTTQNKGCWAVLLESSNRMVLNSWINPTTTLHREDTSSISISCETGQRKEFYKITMIDSAESDQFLNNLIKIKESIGELKVPVNGYISRSSSLQTVEPAREVEQTVTQIMEAKCRVFLQNDHGVWTNIGWGNMKLSLETPSHRKRVIVSSDKKTKTIIDSIIREDGVERIGKSVALTLSNMGSNIRIVYLLKMKDEALAIKVFDVMKEKRKR